ncbi:hypothetical protein SLOPH_1836 [Spraguea lophii 42_110]|uniref:Tetratricopeptide repeat protein n=1 Tax=Spraguea lophii (strain 42_110) TaxID=1358809 RepID=S7W8R7_SPRLO|nr:hypothetical protein SLOPH_1836 [Spraguea lophii 42_110]
MEYFSKNIKLGLDIDNIFSTLKKDNNNILNLYLLYKSVIFGKHMIKEYIIELLEECSYVILEENMLSVNILREIGEYERAMEMLENIKVKNNIKINLIGTTAINKKFYNNETLVLALELEREKNNIEKEYQKETDTRIYKDFKIQKLTVLEQKIILLELLLILETEHNEDLLNEKTMIYLERLLYENNEYDKNLKRAIVLIDAKINGNIEKVSTIEKNVYDFEVDYDLPIILNYDGYEILGRVFLKNFYFESALKIFKKLEMKKEMVYCYVGMDKNLESLKFLKEEMNILENEIKNNENIKNNKTINIIEEIEFIYKDDTSLFSKKLKLREIYHIISELENNCEYYDKSYKLYNDLQPLKLKYKYFIANENYLEAKKTLEIALENFNRESLIYDYGVVLIKLKEFKNAIDVFYKIENKSYQVLINLINLLTIENREEETIDFLKKVMKMRNKENITRKFISLCLKYNKLEEIRNIYSTNKKMVEEIACDFENGKYLIEQFEENKK